MGLLKGEKITEDSRAIRTRVAAWQKQKTVAMRAYLQMKSPKLVTEIIQPLTERETEPDRVMQKSDGQCC